MLNPLQGSNKKFRYQKKYLHTHTIYIYMCVYVCIAISSFKMSPKICWLTLGSESLAAICELDRFFDILGLYFSYQVGGNRTYGFDRVTWRLEFLKGIWKPMEKLTLRCSKNLERKKLRGAGGTLFPGRGKRGITPITVQKSERARAEKAKILKDLPSAIQMLNLIQVSALSWTIK